MVIQLGMHAMRMMIMMENVSSTHYLNHPAQVLFSATALKTFHAFIHALGEGCI